MALFLNVNTRYKDVEIGIFNGMECIAHTQTDSKHISKNFLSLIDDMLKTHAYELNDFDFISAHQGPAPFTTLRASLASINGLAFATHTPLIGVNGLEALYRTHTDSSHDTIVLLNAFCKDVYFCMKSYDHENHTVQGCMNIDEFIAYVNSKIIDKPLHIIGNGLSLYKQDLKEKLTYTNILYGDNIECVDLQTVALHAYNIWENNHRTYDQLMPLYLKGHSAYMVKQDYDIREKQI
jgi:tRNA threonylcarbamoyladenosine biosynthesis protein TsaB